MIMGPGNECFERKMKDNEVRTEPCLLLIMFDVSGN